jgi:hypothetical protein
MTPEQRLEQSMAKLRDSLHELELAFVDLATELQILSATLIAWEASYLAAYRSAGAPYGDTAEGMARWVAERYGDTARPAGCPRPRNQLWQPGQ